MHFDCAGSHSVCVCVSAFWAHFGLRHLIFVTFHRNWLLWDLDSHVGCAGSHKVSVAATSSKHTLNPQPPEWNGNPCVAFGNKPLYTHQHKSSKYSKYQTSIVIIHQLWMPSATLVFPRPANLAHSALWPLWRKAHFQANMLKTYAWTTFGRWDVKKSTPLRREAHVEVKMWKAHHFRTTFGRSTGITQRRQRRQRQRRPQQQQQQQQQLLLLLLLLLQLLKLLLTTNY